MYDMYIYIYVYMLDAVVMMTSFINIAFRSMAAIILGHDHQFRLRISLPMNGHVDDSYPHPRPCPCCKKDGMFVPVAARMHGTYVYVFVACYVSYTNTTYDYHEPLPPSSVISDARFRNQHHRHHHHHLPLQSAHGPISVPLYPEHECCA